MRAEILSRERRRRWTDQQRLEIIGSVGLNGATSMVEPRLTKGRTLRFGSDIEVISLTQLIRCVEAA